ncbi:MAG: hypothetical protein OHK0012_20790 [Synechococcales cyanobacterium]
MNDFGNIGHLLNLPIESIEPDQEYSASEFLLLASAKLLKSTGSHNWLPIVVVEAEEYRYKIVANSFIFAVALQANAERVWAIVIPNEEIHISQSRVLAREILPKISLSTADREEIMAGLKFVMALPLSPIKTIDPVIAASRISENPDRKYWTDFSPISSLKCGLTKGKKLDSLAEIFYLTPEKPPESLTAKKSKKSSTTRSRKKPKAALS